MWQNLAQEDLERECGFPVWTDMLSAGSKISVIFLNVEFVM